MAMHFDKPTNDPIEEYVASPFEAASLAFREVRSLVRRIEYLADRLTGAVPTTVDGVGGAGEELVSKPPLFRALSLEAEITASVIRNANSALERIEQHLPTP